MASVLSSSVDDDDDDDDDDVAGIVDVVTRFLSASRRRPLDIVTHPSKGGDYGLAERVECGNGVSKYVICIYEFKMGTSLMKNCA